MLMLINQKYVKNIDLLGINFHTVTQSFNLKSSNKHQNNYFQIVQE